MVKGTLCLATRFYIMMKFSGCLLVCLILLFSSVSPAEILLDFVKGGGEPIPDVRVNGLADPVQVGTNIVLSITVALEPASMAGANADWWVAAQAPSGWYYYNYHRNSWLSAGKSYAGIPVAYHGPLFDLSPFKLLEVSGLPEGYYSVYFGVDTIPDGKLTAPSLFYDSGVVLVGGRADWICQRADGNSYVGIDPSMVLDDVGNPHISHHDTVNKELRYSKRIAGIWFSEAVDSDGDVGEGSGIAIGSDSNPYVSYIDNTNYALKCARKAGGSWEIEIVYGPAGDPVLGTSIALDSNGFPCIVFNQAPDGHVRYARWDGDSWNIESVYVGGDGVYLALDSNDIPHISLIGSIGDDSRICHLTKAAGTWVFEVLDTSAQAGGDTGITVDTNNYPHIAYRDYSDGSIKYARWNGSSWHIGDVATGVGNGEGVKIAIDNQNSPHIAYNDYTIERLKYAVLIGDSWHREVVKKLGNPAIAVDSMRRPHIAHQYTDIAEAEFGVLKYSHKP